MDVVGGTVPGLGEGWRTPSPDPITFTAVLRDSAAQSAATSQDAQSEKPSTGTTFPGRSRGGRTVSRSSKADESVTATPTQGNEEKESTPNTQSTTIRTRRRNKKGRYQKIDSVPRNKMVAPLADVSPLWEDENEEMAAQTMERALKGGGAFASISPGNVKKPSPKKKRWGGKPGYNPEFAPVGSPDLMLAGKPSTPIMKEKGIGGGKVLPFETGVQYKGILSVEELSDPVALAARAAGYRIKGGALRPIRSVSTEPTYVGKKKKDAPWRASSIEPGAIQHVEKVAAALIHRNPDEISGTPLPASAAAGREPMHQAPTSLAFAQSPNLPFPSERWHSKHAGFGIGAQMARGPLLGHPSHIVQGEVDHRDIFKHRRHQMSMVDREVQTGSILLAQVIEDAVETRLKERESTSFFTTDMNVGSISASGPVPPVPMPNQSLPSAPPQGGCKIPSEIDKKDYLYESVPNLSSQDASGEVRYDEETKTFEKLVFPTQNPANRSEVLHLQEWVTKQVSERIAKLKKAGVAQSPIACEEELSSVYHSAIVEIARQESMTCYDRSQLLLQLLHDYDNVKNSLIEELKFQAGNYEQLQREVGNEREAFNERINLEVYLRSIQQKKDMERLEDRIYQLEREKKQLENGTIALEMTRDQLQTKLFRMESKVSGLLKELSTADDMLERLNSTAHSRKTEMETVQQELQSIIFTRNMEKSRRERAEQQEAEGRPVTSGSAEGNKAGLSAKSGEEDAEGHTRREGSVLSMMSDMTGVMGEIEASEEGKEVTFDIEVETKEI